MNSPEGRTSGVSNMIAAVVIVVGIAGLLLIRQAAPPTPPQANSAATLSVSDTTPLVIPVQESDPVLGSADAPITIIEFSDVTCAFCRAYHQDTFPQLTQQYINRGLVRYVYKDFPLAHLDPLAVPAAEAAHCAHDQGKFWEFIAQLTKTEAVSTNAFTASATALGLDEAQFTRCVTSRHHATTVAQNVQTAVAAGITGAPAFVVNGTLVEGALTIDDARQLLDQRLTPLL